MAPRTRSQAAADYATPSSSGRGSRYAMPTAFDALRVEGESSSESEPEESELQTSQQPLSATTESYDASRLTPAKRRGKKSISAASESESVTESLEPSESTRPSARPSKTPATPVLNVSHDVQPRGSADAAATLSGSDNSRTHTNTTLDDYDPNHVHAAAEAVAETSSSHPEEPPATANASTASTANGGHYGSNAKDDDSEGQVSAQAHAQAHVDTLSDASIQTTQDKVVQPTMDTSTTNTPDPEPETELSEAQHKAKKQAENKAWRKKVYERTVFTFAMIFGFIALLLMGHPYMILLVMLLATLVYREIVGLFNLAEPPSLTNQSPEVLADAEQRRKDALWNKTLSWYFFVVANYFLYGESLIYYFKHIVYEEVYFVSFAKNHRFLSLMLYVFGFMAFILQLRRDNLKHQFGLFSWVHMTLFLIVVSSHFMVNSILEGLIWFWVPASLIICNDIFAYVCGMLFGRTPLISLSPKKTREGFFGAFVITVLFSYFWGSLFQRYNYMICPAVSLGENAWSKMQCEPNHVFVWHHAQLPQSIANIATTVLSPWTGGKPITHLPYTLYQLHSAVMASFASLVAPFGGFFASGFKRAFKIKDFGDSIPGHGGLTDRFDCQFLMGLWAYTYYASLIREHHTTVGAVLQTAVTQLRPDELLELYKDLEHYLRGEGSLVP